MLLGFVLNVLVNGAAFLLIAKLLPGFTIRKTETAFLMAIVYGLLSGIVTWVLGASLIAAVTFVFMLVPLLGLLVGMAAWVAWFVIGFVTSVVVLVATDAMIDEFEMDGPATAVLAALMLGAINLVLGGFLRMLA